MPPETISLFESITKLGAPGFMLLALYWMRQDKAVAIAAFEKLNEERKKIQDRSNEVIEKCAIEMALLKDKIATLTNDLHDRER